MTPTQRIFTLVAVTAMVGLAQTACDDYQETVWSMKGKAVDAEAVTNDNWVELGPWVYRNNLTVKVRSGASDNDLSALRKARDVKFVSLSGTKISDRGLRYVAELPALRELSIANTRVTDAGLDYLAQVKSLRLLDTHGSRVTERGLTQLKEKLPFLQIAR